MIEFVKKIPPIASSGLLTLIGLAATAVFDHVADASGQLTLEREYVLRAAGAIGSVFVGLIAYATLLKERDSKRARVKFAKEQARPICECTESGEIMLLKERNRMASIFWCPRCQREVIDFDKPDTLKPIG